MRPYVDLDTPLIVPARARTPAAGPQSGTATPPAGNSPGATSLLLAEYRRRLREEAAGQQQLEQRANDRSAQPTWTQGAAGSYTGPAPETPAARAAQAQLTAEQLRQKGVQDPARAQAMAREINNDPIIAGTRQATRDSNARRAALQEARDNPGGYKWSYPNYASGKANLYKIPERGQGPIDEANRYGESNASAQALRLSRDDGMSAARTPYWVAAAQPLLLEAQRQGNREQVQSLLSGYRGGIARRAGETREQFEERQARFRAENPLAGDPRKALAAGRDMVETRRAERTRERASALRTAAGGPEPQPPQVPQPRLPTPKEQLEREQWETQQRDRLAPDKQRRLDELRARRDNAAKAMSAAAGNVAGGGNAEQFRKDLEGIQKEIDALLGGGPARPMPRTQEELVDGETYETSRGPARWNAAKGKFDQE